MPIVLKLPTHGHYSYNEKNKKYEFEYYCNVILQRNDGQ